MDQLREQGIVLLKNLFDRTCLIALNCAADRCFEAIGHGIPVPNAYRFNPFSHSVLLSALRDFGCGSGDLTAPLSQPALHPLFSEAIGPGWACNWDQTWLRKKFAPRHAPSVHYHPHTWHQDGALGVDFPLQPGPVLPMTTLVTCWIPLNACGHDSPALEFVTGPQRELLHFTGLGDPDLRNRFAPEKFWAPQLALGDGLVFLNSVLHRTYTKPEMDRNRLSVEYRIFPRRHVDERLSA